jgi:glycosyltransferase involved in cell wall biosynthesis
VRAAFYRLRLRIAAALIAVVAAVALVAVALVARLPRAARRRLGRRPRIVWGNTPIINIKYWSQAVRDLGYESRTIVTHVYPSYDPRDFDLLRDEWLTDRPRLLPVRDYLLFARILWSADVVSAFFDGGFLRGSALERLEIRLLHLAGSKLVLLPFGSDIAVRGHLGPTEAAFAVHYAHVLDRSNAIRERVDRLCASADLVIRTLQIGYLPRHEAFWSHGLAVDTERWRPLEAGEQPSDGAETVIVHAPNHRQLKGTDAVLAAVERLRGEGLAVRLELLEGRPNDEVREVIRHADVAVDQLLTGYGLFAVECMAAGLPVISNLRWMPTWMRAAPSLAAAPIVDADEADVTERLRELVRDPELRRRLGRDSRSFALGYHSYAAIGRDWAAFFEHVWRGRPLPRELAPVTDASSGSR